MRYQTWNQQGELVSDIEITREADGTPVVIDNLAGTSRGATPDEAASLEDSERWERREQARERALAAIRANQGQAPWGAILYDLAVVQGWIEP